MTTWHQRARNTTVWTGAAVLVMTSAVAVARPAVATPRAPGVAGEAGSTQRAGHPQPPVLHHRSTVVNLGHPQSAARSGTASLTAPNAVKGTGDVRNGTLLSFPLTDRLTAKINVGSGNLMISSTDLTVPALGHDVAVGPVYNSLMIGSALEIADYGHGWRARSGSETGLFDNGDGSLTYVDPTGATGVFTSSGTTYTTDGQFKAILAHNGTGWKLTDHGTGTVTTFDANGVVVTVTDRNGQAITTGVTGGGQSTVVGNRGASTPRTAAMDYGSSGIDWISQSGTDSTTRYTYYTYDTAGNLKTITDPKGATTTFTYDSNHQPTTIDTPIGKTTVTYDSSHRATSLTRWDTDTSQGGVTRLWYVSSSQTILADADTDPAQGITDVPHTTFSINANGRVTNIYDQDGHSHSATYNSFNDIATSTDAYTKVVTNTYGANSGESLTKTQLPTGAATTWAYANTATGTNPTGNFQASSSTDPQSHQTLYSYNGAGNTLQAQNALPATAKVTYNSDGTVASSTDPANGTNATTYTYNTDKQLTGITPPTGTSLGSRTFTYDAYARLSTATDGAGRTSTYSYDTDDRVTNVAYSDATTAVHYTYDTNGNLTHRSDATGTNDYYYNTLNRLTDQSTGYFSNWHTYGYDWVGNTTSTIDGRGTDTYTYDDRNLMTAMTTSGGSIRYVFGYDYNGRRTSSRFDSNAAGTASSSKTTWTFDSSGRVKTDTTILNDNTSNVAYDGAYCYTAYTSGQPCATTGDTDQLRWKTDYGSNITTYGYDTGNRVNAAAGSSHSKAYAYNTNGARTSVTTDGTTSQTRTYNAANQITTTGYTYDGAGNTLTAPGDTGRTYNAAEQMLTTHNGGTAVTLTYAGTGQNELATTTTSTTTTYYTYGPPDPFGVPQVSSYHVVTTATGAQTDYYIERDPSTGQPIGLQYVSGGTHHHYGYVIDGLGSVNNLVATSGGGLTSTGYDYWPYGENRSTPTIYDTVDTANIIGYAAGTKAVGLTKFGTRWYDPTIGQFTQQDKYSVVSDPANGNRYAYAADNPVTNTDPTGNIKKSTLDCGLAIATLVGTTTALVVATIITSGFAAALIFYGIAGGSILTACY